MIISYTSGVYFGQFSQIILEFLFSMSVLEDSKIKRILQIYFQIHHNEDITNSSSNRQKINLLTAIQRLNTFIQMLKSWVTDT